MTKCASRGCPSTATQDVLMEGEVVEHLCLACAKILDKFLSGDERHD